MEAFIGNVGGLLGTAGGVGGQAAGMASNQIGQTRHQALNTVTAALIAKSKQMKVRGIILATNNLSIVDRAKSFGFKIINHPLMGLPLNE